MPSGMLDVSLRVSYSGCPCFVYHLHAASSCGCQSLRAIVVFVMVLMLTRSSRGSRPPPLCLAGVCVQETVVYASRVPEVEFCKVR